MRSQKYIPPTKLGPSNFLSWCGTAVVTLEELGARVDFAVVEAGVLFGVVPFEESGFDVVLIVDTVVALTVVVTVLFNVDAAMPGEAVITDRIVVDSPTTKT